MIDAGQKAVLKLRAQGVLERDAHAGADGAYLIRSLYFDSPDDACFYENENGDDPREKYRIRFYNCDASRISLECKAKRRGMTRKTACPITRGQCERFMAGEIPSLTGRYRQDSRHVRADAVKKSAPGGDRAVCPYALCVRCGQCAGDF